jgi:hypothetical protein
VLVFVVNQTDQERTEGVRRLLGGRARAGQHRLNMGVGAAGDGLTIREDGRQGRQRAALFLRRGCIKEGVKLGIETGLSRQQIPHEKMIDGGLMT